MLREHQYIFSRLNMVTDFALAASSLWVAHLLRNYVVVPYLLPNVYPPFVPFSDYVGLIWILPFLTVIFLRFHGYYQSQRIKVFGATARAVALGSLETAVAAMALSFFFSRNRASNLASGLVVGEAVSRGVLVLMPLVLFVLLMIKSWLVRRFLVSLRKGGRNWRTILLVGSGENLRQVISTIRSHPFWGFKLQGVIDDTGREAVAVEEVPVVGNLASMLDYVRANPVDEIVFVPGRRSLEDLAPYFEKCEIMGTKTRLTLNFFPGKIARPVLDSFDDLPVLTYSPVRDLNAALLFKYAFDRVVALILLILFFPVMVVLAVLIAATSPSWRDPIFYNQIRLGLNGRPFKLWKFRSMRLGADLELAKLAAKNEMRGPVFKIKRDPRITPIGRLLRKTSLDELPQLWNVLIGEMSLVGPRPPIPAEVEKYDQWQLRRLSMKPGITCLWQVNGRNQLPFDTWMKLDLEYIDNWSLMLDLKILLKTIYVVATGYGAM